MTLQMEPKSQKVNHFKVLSMVTISDDLKAMGEKLGHFTIALTKSHWILENFPKSHHISLILTTSQYISPNLNVKSTTSCGTILQGRPIFYILNINFLITLQRGRGGPATNLKNKLRIQTHNFWPDLLL